MSRKKEKVVKNEVKKEVSAIKSIKPFYIVIILMGIGLFLRIYHLDFNSLWLDEGSTYMFSSPAKTFMDIWNITASGEVHPPLFYWLTHIILSFSVSEVSLRILPLLFGVVTIPIFYYIGKELHSDLAGYIAAGLLVVSQFHIVHSQEARSYTMFLFLISLLLYLFIKIHSMSEDSPKIKYYYAFLIAVMVLSFWTHFWSITVIVPLFMVIFYETIINHKKYIYSLITLCFFLIGTIPLIIVLKGIYESRTATPIYWGMKGADLVSSFIMNVGSNNTVYVTIIFVFIAIGLYVIYLKDKYIAYSLGIFLIFGVMFSVIMSYKLPMMPRYLIPLLGIIFPLMGVGIAQIYQTYSKKWAFLMFALAVIFSIFSLVPYYSAYSHQDWDGYSSMLTNLTTVGDTVIVIPDYNRNVLDFYYNSTSDGTDEVGVYNKLDDVISSSGGRTFYVITSDIVAVDPDGIIYSWLESNTNRVSEYTGILTYEKQV